MQRTTGVTDVAPTTTPPVSREILVREWVRRRLGTVAHELRVARVAGMIFQLTKRWHGLTRAEQSAVAVDDGAQLVHDVEGGRKSIWAMPRWGRRWSLGRGGGRGICRWGMRSAEAWRT